MQNQNDRNVQAFVLAFVTLISLGTSPSLAAFEAIITNERSGDLIHINSEGSTTHVATLCSRPRGMTKGINNSQVLIACSDDDKVITYNRKTKAIETEIKNVTGAMNLTFHKPSGQLLVTNEGASRASVYNLESGRLIAE